MTHCYRVGQGTKLVLEQGDLTAWEGDAIVNAGKCGLVLQSTG